jgi:NADP-dependent 3-hydroxy acid dehydrogenase YdfG
MSTETPHLVLSVAITGAGGLGREIAIGLADNGYRVFGTARKPQEVEEVQPRNARRRPDDDLRHHRPGRGTGQSFGLLPSDVRDG